MPNPQPPLASLTLCGRRFSISEVEMIREVVAQCSSLSLTEISRTLSELLDWKRPNGKLKNHECRLLLERLRDQEALSLPALQPFGGRGPRRARLTSHSDPQPPIIPKDYEWPNLFEYEGIPLERFYHELLQTLGRGPGMLGVIFRKAQNRIQDPAKLRRLIADLIDKEHWMAWTPTLKATPMKDCLKRTRRS